MELFLCPEGRVWREDGAAFSPEVWRWRKGGRAPAAKDRRAVAALEALRAATRSPHGPRPPIGVIGGRSAPAATRALAFEVGRLIGESGLPLLCGGKSGVMAAACRGAREAGGLTIGLLPDGEWTGANAHVALPIATGIGVARNAIIARACPALIAVGGGYGTLSEMALALQFGRRVVTLAAAPEVEGAVVAAGAEDAVERAARRLLDAEAKA